MGIRDGDLIVLSPVGRARLYHWCGQANLCSQLSSLLPFWYLILDPCIVVALVTVSITTSWYIHCDIRIAGWCSSVWLSWWVCVHVMVLETQTFYRWVHTQWKDPK